MSKSGFNTYGTGCVSMMEGWCRILSEFID
jgi:hypothetical protein